MKPTTNFLKFLLLGIIIPVAILTSCRKEEISNQMTYDGRKFKIAGGLIENFGIANLDQVSYRMGLTLFSDGLTYNLGVKEFSGQGAILHINLYSSNSLDLASGTYIYDLVSKNSLTFDWGVIIDNIAFSLAGPYRIENKFAFIDGVPIVSGTMKVTRDNAGYTITFSGKTSLDKSVNATYKGPLPVVDQRVTRK